MGQVHGCLRGSAADKVPAFPVWASAGPGIDVVICEPESKSYANADQVITAPTECKDPLATARAGAQPWQECVGPQATKLVPSVSEPGLDATNCLGQATQPSLPYEVGISGPPLPPCHEARLQALPLNDLLNTAPKDDLQNILKLVCNIFKTEHALIALLFDRRVYITNGTGNFKEGDFPWRYSFCGWTMASEQHTVMVIPDAQQDARFRDNPVGKKYCVRFYAGAPLVSSSGHRLGTLCFADDKPRVFDDSSLRILCNFSELVTRELERDIALAEASHDQSGTVGQHELTGVQQGHLLLRSLDCLTSAVLLVDTAQADWPVLYANRGWELLLQQCHSVLAGGVWTPSAEASLLGHTLWPTIRQQLQQSAAAGRSQFEKVLQLVSKRESFELNGISLPGTGGAGLTLAFRSAGKGALEGAVGICLPTYLPDASSSDPGKEGMYFVTVRLQPGQSTKLPAVAESPAAEAEVAGNSNNTPFGGAGLQRPAADKVSLSTCRYPQLDHVNSRGTATASSNQQQKPGLWQDMEVVVMTGRQQLGHSDQEVHSEPAHSIQSWDAESNSNFSLVTSADGLFSSAGSLCSSSLRLGHHCLSSATAARLICRKIEGLKLGGQVAAGSYGRVFKGDYFGTRVAVKVLDGDAVLRREAATGLCLEALVGEQLKHPNVVSTLAWAVVTGKEQLPKAEKLWGETLDSGRPSVKQTATAQQAAEITASGSASELHQSVLQPHQSSGQSFASDYLEEDYDGSSLLEGQSWLVMEYMDRGCLQDAIDCGWLRESTSGPVSLMKVVSTATEIASGMLMLHNAGIIHGDLSAFNVLLTSADASASLADRGFAAKVSDFGLSRVLEHKSKVVTKTYGTITHMPPELLEKGISSKAADVYSFGVLLWQMVSSSRAWAGMSHQAVVRAVCCDKLSLVFPPDVPDALVALGQACMEYDPQDRPSFDEIMEVLEPFNAAIQLAGAASLQA